MMIILSNKCRIVSRPFWNDEDFWRIRRLLIETYPITPTGFNWEIRRWDGWRFYRNNLTFNTSWEKLVHLWETEDGNLVGAVHPERTGEAHLELHPDYRHIEENMITWAEDNLTSSIKDGNDRQLSIWVPEYDILRCHLLEKRGYEKTALGEVQRRLRFGDKLIPQSQLSEGYIMRTTHPNDDDYQRIADLLNAAFGRSFHTAKEFEVFSMNAPCFRHDLNLVAVAPDESFAGYVGVNYIEENQYGVFEPVCTHPNHLRKGLARSLMLEGLRRLKAAGAADVYVVTGDQEAANKLYNSIGFTEAYKKYLWKKAI